ncbi:MAG: anion permease, partial [Actinomycetaceae bacterium]|nr:anion permease [Actinomycetaceae bacterium]
MAALVGFLQPLFLSWPGLAATTTSMCAVFLSTITLWFSEAIPLVTIAVFILLAEVLLNSDEALITLPQAYEPEKYAAFFYALAHGVIILFLGGFMLADGAAKFGADKALAAVMLNPFQKSARITVLGIMAITDNGPGIPEEIREHIFTPHFTTKQGTIHYGLG